MTQLYNISSLKQRRRRLRKDSPDPETIIWNKIRNRQIKNCKFRRQYSIGNFVVDFYCPKLKLAIEVDGDSHFDPEAILQDRERQGYLEAFGIIFLRFTNLDVSSNIEGVVETIRNNIFRKPHLTSP